jgi:hypothetical protein
MKHWEGIPPERQDGRRENLFPCCTSNQSYNKVIGKCGDKLSTTYICCVDIMVGGLDDEIQEQHVQKQMAKDQMAVERAGAKKACPANYVV